MTLKEYKWFAVDKVIGFLREQGLKYRRSDFLDASEKNSMWYAEGNNAVRAIGNPPESIVVIARFSFERTGKKLKSSKDRFLNYFNARVKQDGVYFSFSLRELDLELLKGNDDEEQGKIEKIMERVTKLLALADPDKNTSEAEAIAASMKAQELLAKYNLDIADVRGEYKEEPIEQCVADVGTGKKWKYTLADVLAKSYCCRCFYVGAEQIVFYGHRQSAVMCRRIFVYLFKVGNRLATAYVKERRENWQSTESTYNSFCIGFVAGIDKELSAHCTALALVVPKEVNESFEVFSESFKAVDNKIKNLTDAEAYQEGVVEGKRALNAQYLADGSTTHGEE